MKRLKNTFRFNSKHLGGVVNFFTSSTSGEFVGEDLFNNSRFYSDEELDNASLIRSNLSFDITKTPSLEKTMNVLDKNLNQAEKFGKFMI